MGCSAVGYCSKECQRADWSGKNGHKYVCQARRVSHAANPPSVHKAGVFVYIGGEGHSIPQDVAHVNVHPTVRAIEDWAFFRRLELKIVNLREGLEEIGQAAFGECTSLHEILIPPAVKAIKRQAFLRCSQMTTVILGKGLEEIREAAFGQCSLLHEILIPHTIKSIKEATFLRCSQMTKVFLGEGLEEIGVDAFCECTSLQEISISPPPSKRLRTRHSCSVRS